MHSLALKSAMAIAAALLIAGAASSPAFAETVFTTVSGKASPYLAGMPPGSTCCLNESPPNDTAPEESPVQVFGIPLSPGTVLTFSVSGGVSNEGLPPTDPPDGGVFFTSPFSGLPGTDQGNGIARMNAPVNALVGVFLDDGVPSASPAPPGLDFSDGGLGTAFGQLCPGLRQPFFIGDGLTGRGTGAPQQFVVPAGATRLFLGTVDGFDWNTNSGAFSVQVTSTAPMSIATGVNQPTFGVGETMLASVALNSPAQAGAADFFTGLLHPDGSTLEFLTSSGGIAIGNIANPSTFQPVAVGIPLGSPISVSVPNIIARQWTGAEPRGTYVFFLLGVRAGTFADGTLTCNDTLGLALTTFSFP
jgi:hypothetical protein